MLRFSKNWCASHLSAIALQTAGSGTRTRAGASASRARASRPWSRSDSGTTRRTSCSETSEARAGTYSGASIRGTIALLSAWYSAGASESASAATVKAPARPKAEMMSTRWPAHVKRTAVTARERSRRSGRLTPAAGCALVRAGEERARRAEQDPGVDAWRPVLDVPEVEVDSLVPGERRATVDLCPAGQARLHREAAQLPLGVALDLVAKRRPRPDHRHLAAHDVPELRQLVDRRPAEETPDASDARIAPVDREPGPELLRPDDHRPQLEQLEVHAVETDAGLPVQDGTAVLELGRDRGQTEERRGDDQPRPRERDVERPVHRVADGSQAAGTPRRR